MRLVSFALLVSCLAVASATAQPGAATPAVIYAQTGRLMAFHKKCGVNDAPGLSAVEAESKIARSYVPAAELPAAERAFAAEQAGAASIPCADGPLAELNRIETSLGAKYNAMALAALELERTQVWADGLSGLRPNASQLETAGRGIERVMGAEFARLKQAVQPDTRNRLVGLCVLASRSGCPTIVGVQSNDQARTWASAIGSFANTVGKLVDGANARTASTDPAEYFHFITLEGLGFPSPCPVGTIVAYIPKARQVEKPAQAVIIDVGVFKRGETRQLGQARLAWRGKDKEALVVSLDNHLYPMVGVASAKVAQCSSLDF